MRQSRLANCKPQIADSVLVADPPKIARFDFGADISAGSRVTTTCSIVSGTPPFEIQWLKDGRPVSSSGTVLFDSGRESSVVVFKPVSVEDVANYTCLVKNAYGTDSFTARLVVKCMRRYPQMFD